LDNRLRETAVKVAVWASTQHIVGEVWFAGSRVTAGPGATHCLDIIVVTLNHAQQVQIRRSGRQASTTGWEADMMGAVGEHHTLQILNAPSPVLVGDAVRIFSRGDAPASEIRCSPQRSETLGADASKTSSNVRGDNDDVRTL
jgi:hypothetical protein